MRWRKKSLQWRLTARLVLVQGIAIVLSAILGIGTIVVLYDIGRQIPNPADPGVVAGALGRDEGGALVLRPTAEFEQLRHEAPGLWFVARDEGGQEVTFGSVPAIYADLAGQIEDLGSASLRGSGDGRALDAFVRVYEDGQERLHVMAGHGRLIDVVPATLQAINQYLFMLFAILAVATTAVITWIIRREVRAVEAVVAQADMIDIDQRGMKLPADRLPSEIEPLASAFNATLERIDKSYLRQQRFLAAAAHELKTPIAILQTRIETSVQGPERPQLLLDVARLNTLAEQLLDVQRLEHMPAADATTDLVALARTAVADLAPLAIAAGYGISFESKRERYLVAAEHGAVERVVINLVQNAMVHGGGKGEIGITIDGNGLLEVHDEGPGIPDMHKDEIFEPFHRVKPSSRGSGLGLSLVNDVMRVHGGYVSVADRPDGGTVFRVSFPAR